MINQLTFLEPLPNDNTVSMAFSSVFKAKSYKLQGMPIFISLIHYILFYYSSKNLRLASIVSTSVNLTTPCEGCKADSDWLKVTQRTSQLSGDWSSVFSLVMGMETEAKFTWEAGTS